MGYILYHIKTTVAIKYYPTEKGAKIGTTCSNRNAGNITYAYATEEEYHKNIVAMVTVRNLLSGKEVQIPSNTPRCCDPSTELYHCM